MSKLEIQLKEAVAKGKWDDVKIIVDWMLRDKNLTPKERRILLAVIEDMKASKDEIIQQSITDLTNFADDYRYTWFKAKAKLEWKV